MLSSAHCRPGGRRERDAAGTFCYADSRGVILETSGEDALFARVAEHFVENKLKGVGTLAVIPFSDVIERFNAQVRPALRNAGLPGGDEVVRGAGAGSPTVLREQHALSRGPCDLRFPQGKDSSAPRVWRCRPRTRRRVPVTARHGAGPGNGSARQATAARAEVRRVAAAQ